MCNRIMQGTEMEPSSIEQAKKMFHHYLGRYFHMMQDEEYERYKEFGISRELELEWRKELQTVKYDEIQHSTNVKTKALAFAKYGMVTRDLKDSDGIRFMLDYAKKM